MLGEEIIETLRDNVTKGYSNILVVRKRVRCSLRCAFFALGG